MLGVGLLLAVAVAVCEDVGVMLDVGLYEGVKLAVCDGVGVVLGEGLLLDVGLRLPLGDVPVLHVAVDDSDAVPERELVGGV
jgi:hypothetical protein